MNEEDEEDQSEEKIITTKSNTLDEDTKERLAYKSIDMVDSNMLSPTLNNFDELNSDKLESSEKVAHQRAYS